MLKVLKHILVFALISATIFACTSCGKKDKNTATTTQSGVSVSDLSYKTPEDLLAIIWDNYPASNKFAVMGGDENNLNEDGPGKYSIANAEELDAYLGFPAEKISEIDSAACLINAMNQNTFTCAAYRFKDAISATQSIAAMKDNILARRWMCGFPDSLLIITAPGNYVITIWGINESSGIITDFKQSALTSIPGAAIAAEEPIV